VTEDAACSPSRGIKRRKVVHQMGYRDPTIATPMKALSIQHVEAFECYRRVDWNICDQASASCRNSELQACWIRGSLPDPHQLNRRRSCPLVAHRPRHGAQMWSSGSEPTLRRREYLGNPRLTTNSTRHASYEMNLGTASRIETSVLYPAPLARTHAKSRLLL